MMDPDTDAYPRRRWNHSERDKYVALLIDQLRELERKTDPKSGAQSAKGKDLAAFSALEIAGNLVNALVGWALDHQAGLALEDLEFVPRGTSKTKKHPDYQTSRSMVDDHRHERNGGKEFGPIKIVRALSFAENAGKNQDDAQRRGFAGKWDVGYGPAALQELARQFKAATTNK
jgi:hypothetical protein